MRRRFEVRLPKGDERRGPYVVAAALQTVLLVVLASIVTIPIMKLGRRIANAPRERVDQVQLRMEPARRDSVAARAPARRDDPPSQAPSLPPAAPPASAAPTVPPPVVVPPTIPPPVVSAPGDTVQRVIGRGLIPQLAPRLPILRTGEGPAGPPAQLPRSTSTPATVVQTWVAEFWDSVARAQTVASNQRDPADWTVERGDGKYGVDPKFIYFGKYKVPTMLLALLPINAQANPSRSERNRLLEQMRADIMYHAMRARTETDFNAAVRALRERRERERAAQQRNDK